MTADSPVSATRPAQSANSLAGQLLAWYDRHARTLPWRVLPEDRANGEISDPYRVWLSEIMLQQTTVQAVKPYFEAFTRRWPDVRDLAEAHEEDVMKAWAGLGYYSRARNLKACAETVAREHGGVFPDTEAELLALPGIGPYTAAAIAAIAFDRPAAVVDGNVERVMARVYDIHTPLPAAKPDECDVQREPSLALLAPILQRGLRDRAAETKRRAALVAGARIQHAHDARGLATIRILQRVAFPQSLDRDLLPTREAHARAARAGSSRRRPFRGGCGAMGCP